jgi:hypothetical protein
MQNMDHELNRYALAAGIIAGPQSPGTPRFDRFADSSGVVEFGRDCRAWKCSDSTSERVITDQQIYEGIWEEMAGIDEALLLTVQHFQGVRDKEGQPYILHCLRVMMSFSDEASQQVAVMHDLVEDTEVTLGDLAKKGFSQQVVEAVDLLTHRPEHDYAQYICNLKSNELARKVKMADLRDNASLNRAPLRPGRDREDLRRMEKYLLSYQYLDDRLLQAEYLRRMEEWAGAS